MAAFAVVQLSAPGNYDDREYAKGDVLRLPSDVAARTVRQGRAKPYSGKTKPKNVEEAS